MVIGYYPGCSLSGTAAEYDLSLRAVAQALGVELREVPQWVCCGATSAHAVDRQAALCLAADTLAKARHAGMSQVLAPCAMCYQRLASAAHEMASHPDVAAAVHQALGEAADLEIQQVRPLSVLNWMDMIEPEKLTAAVKRPLAGLKVACYYGCLLVRPAAVTGADNVEAPRSMERIMKLLGAEPVRWPMAMECCGGSFALSRKEVVVRQGRKIYEAACKAGAEVLCLACPMCHANLDMRQTEYAPEGTPLPTLYLTQLLGLAMGLSVREVGADRHFVPIECVALSKAEG